MSWADASLHTLALTSCTVCLSVTLPTLDASMAHIKFACSGNGGMCAEMLYSWRVSVISGVSDVPTRTVTHWTAWFRHLIEANGRLHQYSQ